MWALAFMLMQVTPGAGCDIDRRHTEAREYAGVYVDDFEGQRFFEGAAGVDELDFRQPAVWIDFDRDRAVDEFGVAPMLQSHAYRVRFRGTEARERATRNRDTYPMCGYGHFGMSVHEVRVVDLLAIERLGPVR